MAAIGTLPVLFGTGIHASRPAASAVGKGGLYSCTTHSLVYQTDGSSWTTWATLGSSTGEAVASSVIWDAAGDVAIGTGADTAAVTSRPELIDLSTAGGSNVAFTSPTSDDASLTFLTDQAGVAKVIQCTDVSTRRHAYVSSAVGTGDFDYRMRIVANGITVPHSSASDPMFAFFVADSSLTASTRMSVQTQMVRGGALTGASGYVVGVVNTSASGNGVNGQSLKLPMIHRIRRVGTAVTFYVSTDEGRIWQQCGSATSSLNVGRIGLLMTGGSAGTQTTVTVVHWLRSF